MNLLMTLQTELAQLAKQKGWLDFPIQVTCSALSTEEAIGSPNELDYPIQKQKETMLQVAFADSYGQAFTCEIFHQKALSLHDVLALPLDSDGQRAILIATANAAFCEAGLIDRTIHCKDQQPHECAAQLSRITQGEKVGLFGLQPRFIEELKKLGEVRCVDIDTELIGTAPQGISIEPPSETMAIFDWADRILVTGSATVNDTFSQFLSADVPLHIFGTSGAALSYILGLSRWCALAQPQASLVD